VPNLLVIPAIDLTHGHCMRCIEGEAGTERLYAELSDHPVELAQLWRRENAKCIHVTDIDSFSGERSDAMLEMVINMQRAVDIPVQYVGLHHTIEPYQRLLQAGVYRVAINVLAVTEPDQVHELIDEYTASRVIFGVRAHNGDIDLGGDAGMMPDEEYIRHVYALGGRRVIYSEVDWEGHLSGEDLSIVRRVASIAPVRLTMAGGIASPEHLWEMQAAAPPNVDSVVIGRALYENRFPCQAIWRHAEAALEPAIHATEIAQQSSISRLQ
jgi:phosphoribosylformimino-5-aminoimidazole carboxamide ribotide isomerase